MAIALTYRPFSNDKMAAEDQKKALLEDLSDVVGQVRSGVACIQTHEDFEVSLPSTAYFLLQLADKHRVMKNVAR